MKNRLIANSSYLIGVQLFTKVISFFYALFVARTLGVENFGFYSVALSYLSLFAALADFGVSRFLTREISTIENIKSEKFQSLFTTTLLLRLASASLIFGASAILFYFFDDNKLRVCLTLIAVISVIPQMASMSLDNFFISRSKASIAAIGLFSLNIGSVLAGSILILSGQGVYGALLAVVFGQIIYTLTLGILAYIYGLRLKFNLVPILKVLKGSLPYGFLGVMGLIYFKIDTILLSYLKGAYDTGIYSAGYRFLEALVFIPTSIATVSFPLLSLLHTENKTELKKTTLKLLQFTTLVGAVIALLYFLVLPQVISILLPNYVDSILVIKILSFAIPFMFVHIPLSQVLLSSNKYLKPIIFISIFTLTTNVILNLIFIPKFGFIGAAYVTVFSDVVSLFAVLYVLRKIILK